MLAVAGASLALTIAALVVFFTAFNLLEADAAVAGVEVRAARGQGHRHRRVLERAVPRHVRRRRGRRLAVAGTAPAAVFGFCLALTALWLAASATMAAPPADNEAHLFDGRDLRWPR